MFDLPEELQIAWDILQEGNIPENEELIEYCYSLLSILNPRRVDYLLFDEDVFVNYVTGEYIFVKIDLILEDSVEIV